VNRVALRDGRRLAYLAVGPADGLLVLYLHGAIGSPQTATPELEAVAGELGIRYVMVSRPGFGGSDALPGRTLTDFAGDVAQLADTLGRRRFAVVGVSAGGPYALACAHKLPERVQVAAVVSCVTARGCASAALSAPARLGLRAVRAQPRACTSGGDALLGLARRHPRLVARVIRAGAPSTDRRRLDDPGARELAASRFLAAASGGVGGMVDDYLLCSRPWGFEPSAIRTLVHLWHGMQDPLVPVDDAIHLAAAMPTVQTALDPDEGHFFYRRRLRQILGDVVGAAGQATRSSSSADQPNPRAPSPRPVSGS
jgi:pimeloyl-ACP methyl ester carboxylesterase